MKNLLAKLNANTALGHFVAQVATAVVLAAVSSVLGGNNLADLLVGLGLPLSVANLVVNLVRSSVPNL